MSSIATPSVKQSLLPPPSVISSDNPTTSTFSASPPSISLESDQVSIKHRFETKSQHIDVFFLHMDSKLGSDLTGHYAESFTGKAFTRIIPPYKCQQKKHTSLPASPANTTKTALTNPKHSLDNDKLASSNTTIYTTPDSHDYLQDNVTIKWQRTTSLTKWNMPTPRSSCWISPEDEFGSTLFLAIDEELEVEEGHTWDVFRGGMLICNNESDGFQPVVFKITKFKSFRESIPEKPTDWNPDLDPVRTTVIDKVLNEDFILRQYLVGLQGDLVPYYHGMFVWHEEDDKDDENWIVAMVMEDVGDAMENNVFKYPLEMRKQFLHCLERLHAEKLILGNFAPRHIIQRFEATEEVSKCVFVDFQYARFVRHWKERKREEIMCRERRAARYSLYVKQNGSGEIVESD